jgi:hypothetical protein
MKNSFVAIVVIVCFSSCNNSTGKTAATKDEPYHFDVLPGWTSEHIPFPISFAGSIPYKGVENVRFTSGWGNPSSDEYWSYEFVWWLDGDQPMNAGTLQQNMRIYYTGLVTDNITRRNIPAVKVVPVVTAYKKINSTPGDVETYTGTVNMLDYMVQQPIVLNSLVHIQKCAGHTVILYEMSPKPYSHAVWQELNKVALSFTCTQ